MIKTIKRILLWILLVISAMGFAGSSIGVISSIVHSLTSGSPVDMRGLFGVLLFGFLISKIQRQLGLTKSSKKLNLNTQDNKDNEK